MHSWVLFVFRWKQKCQFCTLGVSIDLNCENISVRTVSIHSWTRFEQPSTNEQKRVNGTINYYG